MTEEELKNKCTERARIFQQAMESCHSSNPIDCIEWFADRIADLEKENAELKSDFIKSCKVKEQGFREAEQALERKDKQLTKAKELLKWFVWYFREGSPNLVSYKHKVAEAEQFLNSEV